MLYGNGMGKTIDLRFTLWERDLSTANGPRSDYAETFRQSHANDTCKTLLREERDEFI